jgi:uncharacterized integral membrane protein (TIGR00698 family)
MSQLTDDMSTRVDAIASRRNKIVSFGPGLVLCVVVTALAMAVNRLLPTVSPLLIAIVVGAALANVMMLPVGLQPGLTFAAKKLLRVGVALLGVQLVLSDIVGLGWGVIAVIVSVVVLGIVGTMFVGRLLGLSWTQRLLVACGFSICGAAAVAAVDGVVDAREEEAATAVTLVVLFGTLMIPTIPLLSDLLGFGDYAAGMWAGASIHEVAQVVAAGGAIGGGALAVAVVVKLARVLMLAPVIAVVSIRQRRQSDSMAAGTRRPALVPLFVLGFLACVALRSSGAIPGNILVGAQVVQVALLTAAMFALGVGVRFATIKKVGPRPLVLATLSTVWVASVALVGVLLVS